MARKSDRKALGRGLSALLGDPPAVSGPTASISPGSGTTASNTSTLAGPSIPIDLIHANPDQPRQSFSEAELRDLSQSIREHGIVQPVLLRPHPVESGAYQIVAGERRWRAAQMAGLHEIPAVVRALEDREMLELAIIENVQRVDLDPVEEAQGYSQLIDTFGYTQEELSQVIGKSRSHLANTMRLLALPEQIRNLLKTGRLTAGHARALINAANPIALAEEAVAKGLTVRQVEALARQIPEARRTPQGPRKPEKDADTRMLEGDLSAAIGMRVRIEHLTAEGGGELSIRYKSLDQLDQLCRKLSE